MRVLLFTIALFAGLVPALATEHNIKQAEADAANVKILVLNGSKNESSRLLKLAPKLTALESVILEGIKDDQIATNLVSSIAACNSARNITFRNCELQILPSNLKMLTQMNSFSSVNTVTSDGEQFYNAVADMPNVRNVTVEGSDFRSLPKSFSRLRTMDNINLVNKDLQLARGYDLNTKTPEQLKATETVQFGFGEDALNLNYTCYNAEAAKSHVQMFRDVLQGAFRQSNIFYVPTEGKAFMKPHPLVKPPVKGVDVAPDVYTISAMTGSQVDYGSGTRISIPPMAFEDANGTPVQGQVDITYREFRDPVDIVLSGIPMTYDSAGYGGDFKSAGMFEMNASQNGNEVYLREGKKVDMKFAVTDTAASYDFYRLDEQKGWVYLSDPGKAETDVVPAEQSLADTRNPASKTGVAKINQYVSRDAKGNMIVSDSAPFVGSTTTAVQLYWDAIRNVHVKDYLKDTTEFDRRYNDTNYFGTTRTNYVYRNEQTQKSKCKSSSRLYLRRRSGGKDYTIVSIEQVNDMWGRNPELSCYSGTFWKIDEKMNSKQLSARFGRRSGINDCRIIQDGSDYYLEMKYYWGFDRIKAEPVKMDQDNKPKAMSESRKQRLFNAYTKRLNSRKNSMARNNEQQVHFQQTRVQRAHNDSLRVWKGVNKVMEDDEKTMDFPTWRDYVKNMRLKMYADVLNRKTTGDDAAYQALSISGMGVYNCDQIARMQKPRDFVAKTISTIAGVVVPVTLFVIDKARNMVFRYGGGWSEGKSVSDGVTANYDDAASMQLLATDQDGNLYQVTEDQFNAAKLQNNSKMDFTGQQLSDGSITPESVRQAVLGPDPK